MAELAKYDTVEVISKDKIVKGFIMACFSHHGKSDPSIISATLLHNGNVKTIHYHDIKHIGLDDIYFLKVVPSRCVLFEKDMSNKLNLKIWNVESS